MQKIMKVNLGPYRDFGDLAERGTPDYSVVEKVDGKMTEMEQRRDLNRRSTGRTPTWGMTM